MRLFTHHHRLSLTLLISIEECTLAGQLCFAIESRDRRKYNRSHKSIGPDGVDRPKMHLTYESDRELDSMTRI